MAADVVGGMEETTTGVIRLRNMAMAGKRVYSIIAVNDAQTNEAAMDGYHVMPLSNACQTGEFFSCIVPSPVFL